MNKKYITILTTACAAGAIVAAMVSPAFAQTSIGVGLTASATVSTGAAKVQVQLGARAAEALATRIADIEKRADQEITRRIDALNALSARVNAMVNLSASEKNSLSSSIQSQITAMNTLQTQISADATANSTSSLKTDVQSITASYRIFALILPQGSIEAASDRVLTIGGIMTDLGTKLSSRISTAQAAGNNVSAATTALTDFNDKIADASTQANAAATEVASLAPDKGDSTIMASNTAALKDARSKILAAQQDFITARADATAIIKALATFKGSATATTTAAAGVQ